FSDAVAKGSGVANIAGAYSITVSPLVNGVHAISASAGDLAGNESARSGSLSVTIDAVTPPVPAAPDLAGGSDSGSSASDDLTNDPTPTFTGSTSGAIATIYVDGVPSGSGPISAGTYSITTSQLAEGTHTISASASGEAGNESARSSGLTITIDLTAPAAPQLPDLFAGSDSGASSTDNLTNDTTPSFAGTAVASASVDIFVDGIGKGSGSAISGGYLITVSPLADGAHSVTASATDVAGNESGRSSGLVVAVDTITPAQPAAPDLDPGSDSGASSSDDITNETKPTLLGAADSRATVTLFVDGTAAASVETSATGAYALVAGPIADGDHDLTAGASDLAGNQSVRSAGLALRIDTQAPAAPSKPDLAAASDTGASHSDDVTSDVTPTFRGSAEAGATVGILVDGAAKGTGTATGSSYAVTTTLLASGTHAIAAKTKDVAGNPSASSGSLAVTIVGHPNAPKLSLKSGGFSGPLKARTIGNFVYVSTSISVDEAVHLSLRAFDLKTSKQLTLSQGSRLGRAAIAARRRALAAQIDKPGIVAVKLRLPLAQVRKGVLYQLVIRAVDPDGDSSVLRIRFRR
nr:Ig-like domain-containing protein [Actinomycetota bacterium]